MWLLCSLRNWVCCVVAGVALEAVWLKWVVVEEEGSFDRNVLWFVLLSDDVPGKPCLRWSLWFWC